MPSVLDVATDGRVGGGSAEILRWPADAALLADLREQGRPRLLVLDPGQVPPPAPDALEDVIWTPADERDLFARLNRLALRSLQPRGLAVGDVTIDEAGVLTFAGRTVQLPAVERRLADLLVARPGRVQRREDLGVAAWGGAPRARRSLDTRISALRARLASVGLTVGCVPGRGFLITVRP